MDIAAVLTIIVIVSIPAYRAIPKILPEPEMRRKRKR